MKILAWTTGARHQGDGQFHYRIDTPLTEAQYQGLCTWEYTGLVEGPKLAEANVLIQHLGATVEMIEVFDLLRQLPILVVVEHDDDMLNLREDNPVFRASEKDWAYYQSSWRDAILESLQKADLITVSVPHLAEVYAEYTSTPIVVLPNTVDEVLLTLDAPVREPGQPLRVGWGGSKTHDLDWRGAADAVRYALNKTGAHLTIMGSDYRSTIGYKNTEYLPWTNNIAEYYAVVNTFHVMLAPLSNDLWNRSKSPLKALEAAALGVPTIASATRPYEDFIVHGETGFLCRTETDWMKALRELDGDEDLRREMGRKARERAAEFTTQLWAPRWIQAYVDGLRRKLGIS